MTTPMQAQAAPDTNAFSASQALFTQLVETLTSDDALAKTHSEVEDLLHTNGMKLGSSGTRVVDHNIL